ncbi:Hypothetical_protein [Hexamita inflata]|uniref:Hypothetical_protein n=1 Tax=Hexamita inflata TaxID=28002 RepID=A0AA86UNI1_9EUKA|nr:Hypothetical protein HINF_LOCUS49649 [Hexamita inflata]
MLNIFYVRPAQCLFSSKHGVHSAPSTLSGMVFIQLSLASKHSVHSAPSTLSGMVFIQLSLASKHGVHSAPSTVFIHLSLASKHSVHSAPSTLSGMVFIQLSLASKHSVHSALSCVQAWCSFSSKHSVHSSFSCVQAQCSFSSKHVVWHGVHSALSSSKGSTQTINLVRLSLSFNLTGKMEIHITKGIIKVKVQFYKSETNIQAPYLIVIRSSVILDCYIDICSYICVCVNSLILYGV